MRDYPYDKPSTGFWAAWVAVAVTLALVVAAGAALWAFWPEIAAWARATQASAQQALARGVNAARAGEPGAVWGLLGACWVYGFAHAVGPGHGKLLIGGAAAASRRTAWRMAGIGFSASLVQGLSAILIAYGALGLFSLSSGWAGETTERVLAPASYIAIALVGLWLALRGGRGLLRLVRPAAQAHPHDHPHEHLHDHGDHAHVCDSGCRHGPSVAETERAESWRDLAALVLSIGIRPCSGALIVLAIAWGFDLAWLGALGAMAMAVGTGVVVAGVGLAASLARDGARLRGENQRARLAFAGVQLAAGLLIAASATGLAVATLNQPPPTPGLFSRP